MKQITIELKSYWGETKIVPVQDLKIYKSIYACDSNYYVNGTYFIDGVQGPVPQQATLAICKSYEEARIKLDEMMGCAQ